MKITLIVTFICVISTVFVFAEKEPSVEKILAEFVADFQEDPAAKGSISAFGIKVNGFGKWQVHRKNGLWELKEGLPDDPVFIYVVDAETLKKIRRGQLSALTAMGRATAKDSTPMDITFMEGFSPNETVSEEIVPFTFHFWTIGFPEIVRFGKESNTRVVHGANVAVLYYQKGLRSAWYQMKKGQHINKSKEEQTNPFPTLVVFTKGLSQARIGGQECKIQAGEVVFIPAGVSHEFWNNNEDPAEFIIIMFGEGA